MFLQIDQLKNILLPTRSLVFSKRLFKVYLFLPIDILHISCLFEMRKSKANLIQLFFSINICFRVLLGNSISTMIEVCCGKNTSLFVVLMYFFISCSNLYKVTMFNKPFANLVIGCLTRYIRFIGKFPYSFRTDLQSELYSLK